ncbi:MAG: hypothetical protein JWO58_3082 [Chitinophagaceae bacterium]|nr:hypothetical protein [Chitinophagaceae bacterium]
MRKGTYRLLLSFVLIVVALAVRILAESTSYVSPDSQYYLSAADHLIQGKGLKAINPVAPGEESYFAVWPAGYPLCIAAVAAIGQTSVLMASKLVNLIFLGLIFMLLYRWFGERAWFVALYFCSYAMLEIYSYTWSEAPFLFFVLLLCYTLTKDMEGKTDRWLFLRLSGCLILLFLFRYAGLIYYAGIGLIAVYWMYKKNVRRVMQYTGALAMAGVFTLCYFYVNRQMTGHYTGIGDRVQLQQESINEFLILFLQGLINQCSIARNYFFNGEGDLLYVLLLVVQLIVVVVLIVYEKLLPSHIVKDTSVKVLVAFSLFYLGVIFVLRKIQPFDPFDYRIMAPFSLPLFIAGLGYMIKPEVEAYFHKTKFWVMGFMLLSLLLNLPKQYLIEWVRTLLN